MLQRPRTARLANVTASTLLLLLFVTAILSGRHNSEVTQCPSGGSFEKLQCDDKMDVAKCFEAKVTCRKWKLEDCCSPVALHKCLSPLAGRAFDTDCSSPLDAREECCADPQTHDRSFAFVAAAKEKLAETADDAMALATQITGSAVEAPTTQCQDGTSFEKLQCDNRLKVSKCFDAKVTCKNWKLEDCCSPVALHKCLSPLAGRAFDTDCSSPIDAREECCADPQTHQRAFQALADLQENIEETASEVVDAATQAAGELTEKVADAAEDLTPLVKDLASKAVEAAQQASEAAKAAALAAQKSDAGQAAQEWAAQAAEMAKKAAAEAAEAVQELAAQVGDSDSDGAILAAANKVATQASESAKAAEQAAKTMTVTER
jgi:hypothetical protein